jgi:hypothetical protein
MFVPPYQLIVNYLGTDPRDRRTSEKIPVPREFLDFLLQLVLKYVDFDERQYLTCNPDVAMAIKKKEFNSGREHFFTVGYFEGRTGGIPVQEDWYLARNPDVAAAKRAQQVESGEIHYRTAGVNEWRWPNSRSVADVEMWKKMLSETSAGSRPK